jgi:starch phosphorylase
MNGTTIKPIRVFPGTIAYFCAEYGGCKALHQPSGQDRILPIFSGGLGVLAADTVQGFADIGQKAVAVGLLCTQGYNRQVALRDAFGNVTKIDSVHDPFNPNDFIGPEGLTYLGKHVSVGIENKEVKLNLWQYIFKGRNNKHSVPLILLDSDNQENDDDWTRKLTHRLYVGNSSWWRMVQDAILGIGGLRALKELGYFDPNVYRNYIEGKGEPPSPDKTTLIHLNEGHGAPALAEFLLNVGIRADKSTVQQLRRAEQFCRFTTHTSVAAGHDYIPKDDVYKVLDPSNNQCAGHADLIMRLDGCDEGRQANMTLLALNLSQKANAVSEIHGHQTRRMFPAQARKITQLTNGIDPLTWVLGREHVPGSIEALEGGILPADVYDRYCPDWRQDPRNIQKLADGNTFLNPEFRRLVWGAHLNAKRILLRLARQAIKEIPVEGAKPGETPAEPEITLNTDVLTIGFARRFAVYKMSNLIFENLAHLMEIFSLETPLQLFFAGKAHPDDGPAIGILHDVLMRMKQVNQESQGAIKVVFLPNYNPDLARLMVSGVDVWLNNPEPPNEACQTSGMKAAVNFVPHASTWDGWWPEGSHGDTTGWTIGDRERNLAAIPRVRLSRTDWAQRLYDTLAQIRTDYYSGKNALDFPARSRFLNKMILAAILNGPLFNTRRMLAEYVRTMWDYDGKPIVVQE